MKSPLNQGPFWAAKCGILLLLVSLLSAFSQTNKEEGAGENSSNEKLLVFSSWEGDFDQVKSLVAEGIDINSKIGPGLTALHCATLRGNEAMIEWLLDNGADSGIRMPSKHEIVDVVFKKDADSNAPGGALAIIQDTALVHESRYGLANVEHSVPIGSDSVFKLASVSKQFTAFAVCMLAQQGRISLEDDIREYIPELHDFGPTIKIIHLLNHTAGLRDTMGSLCLAGWNLDDVITFDHLLTLVLNQKGLNFEPGSEHLYSNSGYVLLVELVQRVTGEPFKKWAESNILDPLEMESSLVRDDYTQILPAKAYGYLKGKDGVYRSSPDNWAMIGPSGFYSTTKDMAKWIANFDAQTIGGTDVFNLMFNKGILNNGEVISYASGLDIAEYRGTKTIGHGGGGAGFTTFVMYFPEHHFSMIVFFNSRTNIYKTVYDVTDVYLGEKLELTKGKIRPPIDDQEINISASVLDKYVGTYKVFPAFYITITRDGNSLMALETNKEICEIYPVSDTEFRVESWNKNIEFNPDEAGNVSNFSFLGRTCRKVDQGPNTTISPITEELTGEYYCAELDTRYQIVIEDGELLAKHRRHGTATLTPAWKEDFRCDWWFMRSVAFNRNEQGVVTGLTVSQWQSRNYRFTKIMS